MVIVALTFQEPITERLEITDPLEKVKTMDGMESFEIGYLEDIDLNAAIGAISPLLGQDQLRTRVGDQLKVSLGGGLYIKKIRVMDESGGGVDGYLTIAGIPRNIYFGQYKSDGIVEITFPGLGIHVPKNTTIDCVGNMAGSGAEQHAVILTCYSPAVPEVNRVPLSSIKENFIFSVTTGTLVAATFGDASKTILDNLDDSEESFPLLSEEKYVLVGVINGSPGAGYGVLGFRHPNLIVDRVFPSAQLVGQGRIFYVDEENPTPEYGYGFDGDASPLAMAAGVGTTAVPVAFIVGKL